LIEIGERESVRRKPPSPIGLKHPLEVPELGLSSWFYPLGFPIELRTNSLEILALADGLWSINEHRFDTRRIRVDVHVLDGDSTECPPTPQVRIAAPLLINVADSENYSIANLEELTTQVFVSRGTLRHGAYMEYFLVGSAPLCHIASSHTTPVHGACVACNGRGVLLCGDSGAGKSSLAYACARAGWTYTSDDASFLLNKADRRTVVGNCHQVRFRPSAIELFPEVEGHVVTPRAAGKPSIEVPTVTMNGVNCSPTAEVDFLVFLNRKASGLPRLSRFSRDAARQSLRQVLYGMPKTIARQGAALERLLAIDVFELRYRDLDWAVNRLETLVREGC